MDLRDQAIVSVLRTTAARNGGVRLLRVEDLDLARGVLVFRRGNGAKGQDPVDYVCDMLVDVGARATMVLHMMDEQDVREALVHPASMIGSDGIPMPGKPHPRWAGTFARVLGVYVRDQDLLDSSTAIHKMTGAAAARFGLHDRGRIQKGSAADLVVFDPSTIQDRSTYGDPGSWSGWAPPGDLG